MTTVEHADSRTFEAAVLLYLACSKLPDGDLADAEASRVLELTRRHTSGLAESYGTQVVADVAAKLAAAPDSAASLAQVVDAAEILAKALDGKSKREFVDELKSIANADGNMLPQERSFIDAVAQTFGL